MSFLLETSTGAWGANAFGYDAAGNRTYAQTTIGGQSYAEVATIAPDSNRVTKLRATGASLATDPFYTVGTAYDYVYGGRKRTLGLRKDGVDQASYLYDFAGRRVSSALLTGTPSTTHFIFGTDGQVLAEHDGATGALLREYVWLDDMPLAIIAGPVATPSYYYMHMGQIGEPLMVTNAAKAKVWDAAIDPWGKPVMLSTATVPLNLRLPGQWAQSEAGVYQNWMRDYDPLLGRYAQADPLGIEAGQNVYAYVDGNPLGYIDPWGLEAWRNNCLVDDDGNIIFCDQPIEPVYWEQWIPVGRFLKGCYTAFKFGYEYPKGAKRFRVAPFGNRRPGPNWKPHKFGRWPHYHRPGPKGSDGKPLPGQSGKRHRPFESHPQDTHWTDKF